MEGDSVVGWTAEESVGGYRDALELLRELIVDPLKYSDEARKLGIKWPRGLLLYGPPGTGKTSLVRAVVRECNAHLIIISPYLVHKGHAGESEKFLREAFSDAFSKANSGLPSVIFIDEIDALCPRRDFRKQQGVRLTSQLATLMDSNKPSPTAVPHVVVIAATNRMEAIDPCLRRHGRFDTELEITAPTEEERLQILKFYTKRVRLDPSANLKSLAAQCNGYVGSDLEDLCRQATDNSLRRCLESFQDDCIPMLTLEDWNHARSIVQPSITRGVTVEIPKVTWDDIGGLKDLKKKLQQAVEWPIKHSAAFSRLGVSPLRGVLLHGPPGCSKTTLAKAVANAAQASFFSLSGSQLFSMYVGEGEALLRNTFRRARLAAPSILFFDEADVVATKREGRSGRNSAVEERLLSTLLTEMDGLEKAKGILVLAATNRPQAIDEALLRPGRFDLVLYVPPPDLQSRLEILRVHTRSMKIGDDVDLRKIAEHTDRFTGAELKGLCTEAGHVALREDIHATTVYDRHFQTAGRSLKPALSEAEIQSYASFSKNNITDGVETDRFVLVHKGSFGAWCWYKTMALLTKGGFRVEAADLTGSEIQSLDTNSVKTMARYVKPLVDLLDKLGDGEKVILVGHDFGGTFLSYVMELYPTRITKAVFAAAAMLKSGQSALDMFSQEECQSLLMRQAWIFSYADGNNKPPTAIKFNEASLTDLLFNQCSTKDAMLASLSMRPVPFGPVMEKLFLSKAKHGLVQRFDIVAQEDFAIPTSMQEA